MLSNLSVQGFKIQGNIVYACNGIGLKNLLRAGSAWLEIHVNVVNGLNVFPVPDGDTGTNMVLTLRAALQEVEQASGYNAGTIAAAAAHGALMGARGNSGVILSQFLQGMADGLKNKPIFTAEDFARAARLGMEQAYQSVIEPVEGTILTVAQAVSDSAQQSAQAGKDMVAQLANVVEAAGIAQATTPELLPVLKEAGVTDSGGQGLLYFLEGWLRFARNQPLEPAPDSEPAPVLLQSSLGVDDTKFGYDIQFLIRGQALDVEYVRTHINRLGWSTVVVGNEHTIKVHVHADNPGSPLSFGAKVGVLSDVVVENLNEQAATFVQRHLAPVTGPAKPQSTATIATLAVVPGEGLAEIFRSLGVSGIVSGGQTMNPSAQDLLERINQLAAENVLILPNNGNIILTAQQVTKLSGKTVDVVPTKTIPQGIAALLAFNERLNPAANAHNMFDAAGQIRTIEITRAVRDTVFNGINIKTGTVIGLLDNCPAGSGQSFCEVVLDTLARITVDDYEIITLYFGRKITCYQAAELSAKIKVLYPGLETEIHNGGQPHYQYIISLE